MEQLATAAVPTLLLPSAADEVVVERQAFGKLAVALQRRAARLILAKATGRTPSFRLVEQFVSLATRSVSRVTPWTSVRGSRWRGGIRTLPCDQD